MIIYGWKASHLITQTTGPCPNCQTPKALQLSVFQKYAHIFWIPFFPIGKTATTQCTHCKQVWRLKEMPLELKQSYREIKTHTRIPLWTFLGLGLLLLFISYAVYNSEQHGKQNQAFIQSPQQADIYEYKTSEGKYTLLKVERIAGDTAFILQNKYETNKRSGLYDIKDKGDSVYTVEAYPILKKELANMLTKKEILNIERK